LVAASAFCVKSSSGHSNKNHQGPDSPASFEAPQAGLLTFPCRFSKVPAPEKPGGPVLDLVIYPDDRLHSQSAPVESISKEIAELAREMVETMRAAGGVGLAGVQVGRLERIFVLQVPEQDPHVFINPEIV